MQAVDWLPLALAAGPIARDSSEQAAILHSSALADCSPVTRAVKRQHQLKKKTIEFPRLLAAREQNPSPLAASSTMAKTVYRQDHWQKTLVRLLAKSHLYVQPWESVSAAPEMLTMVKAAAEQRMEEHQRQEGAAVMTSSNPA